MGARGTSHLVAIVCGLVLACGWLSIPWPTSMPATASDVEGPPTPDSAPASSLGLSRTPVPRVPVASFTENVGQVPNDRVLFYGSVANLWVGFGESSVLFVVESPPATSPDAGEIPRTGPPGLATRHGPAPSVHLRLAFDGANRVVPIGRGELPHRSHYFLGNDPTEWRTNVRSYREVAFENIYAGVDIVYRAGPGGVKYDVLVDAGADLAQVRLRYEGAASLRLHGEDLVVHTVLGDLREGIPYSDQDGTPVPCAYVLREPFVEFSCARDPDRSLLIDPVLTSTLLGGSSWDAYSGAAPLALDSAGNMYLAGTTRSPDFPTTPGAHDTTINGSEDAYVAKLDATGNFLHYATFLGGDGYDYGYSLAVDPGGNAFLTGSTQSLDFPTTPGAYDRVHNGAWVDAYVAKLDATGGTLVYATYLGGGANDEGSTITVDAGGSAYVAGYTYSTGFPTTPGAYDTTYNGGSDVFVAALDPTGGALLYSTFLGGSSDDDGPALSGEICLAVDTSGSAYVTATTRSTDFPVTSSAYDTTHNGGDDVVVAKLDDIGGALIYSTFIGGGSTDLGGSIAVDAAGSAVVVGSTRSSGFPTTPGAYDATLDGGRDAFVAKLDGTGSGLTFGTLLGGGLHEGGYSVALDSAGNSYVTGFTNSTDFPATAGASDTTYNGGLDAFVAKVSATGSAVLYATFLGGSSWDIGRSAALDSPGNVTVSGTTESADFPTTPGAHDTTLDGSTDVFAVKLDLTALNLPPLAIAGGDRVVDKNELVALDGTASSDPNDDVIAYEWAWRSGPQPIPLMGADTATPSFVAPTGAGSAGDYDFALTVSDPWGASGTDEVRVTVRNRPPTAIAAVSGDPGDLGTLFQFDGRGSTDPDGTIVLTSWDFGDTATAVGPTVAHTYATRGSFTVTLNVTDDDGARSSDTLTVTVLNRAPTADGGPDRMAVAGDSVTLLGVGADPDSDALTFVWTQTAGPPAVLDDASAQTPRFTPAEAGTYAFQVTVSDGQGGTGSDGVTVLVLPREDGPRDGGGPLNMLLVVAVIAVLVVLGLVALVAIRTRRRFPKGPRDGEIG